MGDFIVMPNHVHLLAAFAIPMDSFPPEFLGRGERSWARIYQVAFRSAKVALLSRSKQLHKRFELLLAHSLTKRIR